MMKRTQTASIYYSDSVWGGGEEGIQYLSGFLDSLSC